MIDNKGKNLRHVKNLNRNVILQFIRVKGPATKVELADTTRLTFTTINNIVDELLKEGLLNVVGYDASSGGRKPMLLDINSDAVFTIGVHLSASTIKTAVINFKGLSIAEEETKLDNKADHETIIGQIFQTIETIISKTDIARNRFVCIGVASPGPLNPNKGIILSPPNISGLKDVPLKELLEQHFGISAIIEKDANAMALSEIWYGAGKKSNNIIYVDADIGIGSGIIFNRKIYQGFPFGAGEIGHGTIELDGPRCNCGNYGCLEAVASGMAILRRAGEEIRRGVASEMAALYFEDEDSLDIHTVIQAALNQDILASNLLNESARYVGIALANIINFITPETIVIGGLLVNEYPEYFHQVKEVSLSRCFSNFKKESLLQPSMLKHHAGVVGAGTLGLEQYLAEL